MAVDAQPIGFSFGSSTQMNKRKDWCGCFMYIMERNWEADNSGRRTKKPEKGKGNNEQKAGTRPLVYGRKLKEAYGRCETKASEWRWGRD